MQCKTPNIYGYKGFAIRFSIIAVLTALMSVAFCRSRIGAAVLVGMQCIVLLVLFIKKSYIEYLCVYLLFMTLSLEYSYYYETDIYGFKMFKLFGISIGTWCILPVFVVALINIKFLLEYRFSKKNQLAYFVWGIIFINLIGLIMGIYQISINDNGVRDIPGVWNAFFAEVYAFTMLVLIPIYTFFYYVIRYQDEIVKLKISLLLIMVAIIVMQIFSAATPFKGTSWEQTTLLVPLAYMFSPFVIIFCMYFKNRYIQFAAIALGVLGLFFSIKYTVSSGGILMICLIPVTILLKLLQSGKRKEFFWGVVFCIVGVILFYFCMTIDIPADTRVGYKLIQARSIFKIWDKQWIASMPNSARFRFLELQNILEEYVRKPYYFLFGKGIMGTCLDYSGAFKMTYSIGGAFTDLEWIYDVYYSVHETINVMLLNNGLLGMCVVVYVFTRYFKYVYKSPFLAIGFAWFLFDYTYSFTLSMFGIMCLLVGLYDIQLLDGKKEWQLI